MDNRMGAAGIWAGVRGSVADTAREGPLNSPNLVYSFFSRCVSYRGKKGNKPFMLVFIYVI